MAQNHMLIYAMIICIFPYLVVTIKSESFFSPILNL